MFRMMTAAAALSLAVSFPAMAEKGGNGGGKDGEKSQKANGNHGKHGNAKGGDSKVGDSKVGASKVGDRGRDKQDRGNDMRRGMEAESDRIRDVRVERRDIERGGTVYVGDRDARRYADGYRGDTRWDDKRDCPPGLAKKDNGCMPPGLARTRGDYPDRYVTFDRGQRLDGLAYIPSFFGLSARGDDRYFYRDGYLVADGPRQVMIPLLGGALAVGQIWPAQYTTTPLADWQSRYYGFDGPAYRYSDNVVYRIDPESAAIESVAALLTGSEFTVGQPVPAGYDVYNVPYAYRSQYYDNDQAMYRFADGRIYQIDPATMLVAAAIDAVL